MNQTTIQALSAKLGAYGEYLWGILLRQAPITGVTNMVFVMASAAVASFLAWRVWLAMEDDYYFDTKVNGILLLFFIALAEAIFLEYLLPSTINALFNPEYWALQQIIK